MTDVKRASFAIEDMKQGGGNLWGTAGPVRAKITGGKFTKEAPDGYAAEGNPIFGVANFEIAGDAPIEERTVNQSFSLGASAGDNFSISEDGDFLIPTNDDASIIKDSKFGLFASSLQNNGVSKTVMQGFGWALVAGLDGDFKRVEDKARDFGANDKKKSKFPPSTLLLLKLHALPGEVAKPTAVAPSVASSALTTGGITASSAPAAATTSGTDDGDVWPYLETVLKGAGGSQQRGKLTLAVSKAAMENPNRASIARRASEESFIQSLVEAGLVTYGAADKGQPVALKA